MRRCYQLNLFNFWQATLRCKSSVDRCVGSGFRVPTIEKVDDHCARVPKAVKSDRKGKRAHDTQQWTIPIDASGPRCKLSVLWLRSCICDSLNQDVTTISSYAGFFFRAFISSPVRLSPRGTAYRSSFILPIRMRLLFVLSRWFGPINLGYAPCVWMCKFERALI